MIKAMETEMMALDDFGTVIILHAFLPLRQVTVKSG